MALQIRRGTEAQRQSLSGTSTPAIGEPLFTTDTRKLFIGDGSTTGGVALGYYGTVAVAGQGTLSAENNTSTLTLIAGDNIVLTTNATNDSVTISAPRGVEEFNTGSINIFQNNIVGLNSNENIIIDPSGTGIVNINSGLTVTGTITGNLTGNVTGNTSGTSASVTNASQPNITSLGTLTGLTVNGTVSATTVVGNFDGQLNGSVFSDNSTLLVDAINNVHIGDFTTGELTISDHTISTLNSNQDLIIDIAGTGRLNVLATIQASRLELFNDVFSSGITVGSATATNAPFIISTTHNNSSTSTPFSTPLGVFQGPQNGATMTFLRAKGANPLDPQTVVDDDEIATIDFNGFFSADLTFYTAAKIKGVVDGTPSSGSVPGRLEFVATNSAGASGVRMTVSGSSIAGTVPFKLPTFADGTARDAAVTAPEAGMVVLTGTTFQGYNGASWVDFN
jgi:Major tropism determinant N-terminal domain